MSIFDQESVIRLKGTTMKTAKRKSILPTLFIPYTVLFILLFTVIISYFVVSESKNIRESSLRSIENSLINISNNIDLTVETLDTISQNITYSNLVKEHFASYINYASPESDQNTSSRYDNMQNNKILYDLLTAMLGPNSPADQIYLYGLEYGSFGTGLDSTTSDSSVKSKEWYAPTLAANGNKYIFLDSDERLSKYYSYKDGQNFLTLCRVYYNSFNTPQGIVEVKKSMSSLSQLIRSFHSYGEEFYIFDANGSLIYPFEDAAHAMYYYEQISDPGIPFSTRENCNIKTLNGTSVLYYISPYSGLTTVATIDKNSLLSPLYKYILTNLVLLFFTCSSVILVSYFISKRIGTPLEGMYAQIHSFQINDTTLTDMELKAVDTNITELHTLYDALIQMQAQARLALQRELQLQNKEMQARMLALQAQMNPHFLYNSLATIQAMADEGMNDKIELMCQNISEILRYISSDGEQLIALEHEISHTINYLECMKIRYNTKLFYTVQIPDSLYQYKIPKLCIQLIVENAIKFTTRVKDPWYIAITGILTDTYWEIKIKDNGPGFSETELADLQKKFEEIDRTEVLPNLEINGMGLMNIYIRFKLFFDGEYIFRLENCTPSGAEVTIGGYI